jgi:hypothetical protein
VSYVTSLTHASPVSQTRAYSSSAWLPRMLGSASRSVYRSGVAAGSLKPESIATLP